MASAATITKESWKSFCASCLESKMLINPEQRRGLLAKRQNTVDPLELDSLLSSNKDDEWPCSTHLLVGKHVFAHIERKRSLPACQANPPLRSEFKLKLSPPNQTVLKHPFFLVNPGSSTSPFSSSSPKHR